MERDTASWNQRGFVSVFIVGVSTVLLLFLGISIDWGILLRYRRAMQNACDSGAMAGALNLRSSPGTAASRAQWYAQQDMTQNNIQWDQLTAQTQDLNGNADGIAPRQVRVEIQEDVPTYLFRLVRNHIRVRVDCTARMVNIILGDGLVPLGLNYCNWAPLYQPLGYPYPASCSQPPPANLGECSQYLALPFSSRPSYCQTFPITMTVGNNPSNPFGNGNSGLLSMDDVCFDCPSGGRQWRDTFINGSQNTYCFDEAHSPSATGYTYNGQTCANLQTKPGLTLGNVRQGVDARCDSGNPLDRIIQMPLLNPAYTNSGNGRYGVEIWGFAAFELDCTQRPTGGQNPSMHGGFVQVVSNQVSGRETNFDTGVYTVKLVE